MTARATTILIIILIALGLGAFLLLRNNTPDSTATLSLVRGVTPSALTSIRSPLIVTGEARGNWYFEASFPLRVLDANGQELGVSFAQAQGEWMTTEFVPFRGTIIFATSSTATGTLVLEKDNPSGLPENAAEVRIPVHFAETSPVQTRTVKLYFYNAGLDKDADGNILCSAKGLVSFERVLPLSNTPIQDAVSELLTGPVGLERGQAPETEFPLPGVELTGANLVSGVLTLSFEDPQNKTGGGSCRVSILRAQIEATAKQFGGVTTVRYLPAELFQP